MNRRHWLRAACATCSATIAGSRAIAFAEPAPAARRADPPRPLPIGPGVQLFLDDYLVDRMEGLVRRVGRPRRSDLPVLDSATFGTTQPYLTVLHDADARQFRMWYNHGPAIWHAESANGVMWTNPRVAWDLPRGYGCSLVDDGPSAADPRRRFKLANWQATRSREDKPGDDAGMWLGFSPDGFEWTAWDGNPALPTWPDGYDRIVRHGVGDTVDVYYDPLTRRYRAAVKVHALPEDGYAPAPKARRVFRRLVGMSSSADFLKWDQPWRIFAPDEKDEGLLEFYGMGGMHVRGGLHIGLVRVLRDDLPCDPGGPVDGIGYTVLATSRDGEHWHRYREPFLDRNPQAGSWDHAMCWGSATVPLGEQTNFYYGGYARGHKIAGETERQIGLATIERDRYVALTPRGDQGWLRTPVVVLAAGRLTVNARATDGQVIVRILDESGTRLDDLGQANAAPIVGDSLAAEVRWPKPLASLGHKPVRLEFQLRRAELFGCEFYGA